jgi:AGZA family xanthine/uracil permease-like MFS transporter
MSKSASASPRWFVRGDIDGFFGLALDNLIQVLLLTTLSRTVLGFSSQLIYGRMLPGIAVSLVVGNLYYALQARRLQQRTGRADVCALPYGINTVSLIGFVFLVMLPVKLAALQRGATAEQAAEMAFRAGILASIGSGLIEALGAWAVDWIRRYTPRAAMLATLSGIALTFIAAGFLFRTFASPLVAFLPLGAVLMTYFGRVRFPFGIPGGMVAVLLGILLSWSTGLSSYDAAHFREALGWLGVEMPRPVFREIGAGLRAGYLVEFLPVIVPMGLFNVIGSVQNLDSAAAAGDDYETVPSLLANGVGTLLGTCFGSPFPTTIYIGHPGWKALGARTGYSILNGVFFTLVGFTGAAAVFALLIPIEAGMAIVLWIGIVMIAQAFQATPRAHAPAVAIGLLPGIAGWGALLLKTGLRVAGMGTPTRPFDATLLAAFRGTDLAVDGAFALEQGFLLSSMVWAALTVEVIERRFSRAALWALAGAVLSSVGLTHTYQFTLADTVQRFTFEPLSPFALSYAMLALLLYLGRFGGVDRGHAETVDVPSREDARS